MDPTITEEILDDLIPSLESLEAKSTAVLEFLKREGIASDEKLAPYLEQAANASNVRWLGVRVRIERLLSAAAKDSTDRRTDKGEKKPEVEKSSEGEASQSQPEAADNSKSAGPENSDENTGKDKNAGAVSKDAESKSKIIANNATRKDENVERPQRNETPAATGEEQKAA